MQKINKKIFLVAGGTGGHLFPAIAVAQRDKKNEYFFIIDNRVEEYLKKFDFKYSIISSSRLEKNFFKIPLVFPKIFLGILKSIYLIYKFKPSLIIGFGGYTSIPTILAAKILRIKTLLHEQNALMGRTNRLLSRLCDSLAVGFKNTKFSKKNSHYTGTPTRLFKKKNIRSRKMRVLVVGGSQGAKIFSKIIPNILSKIPYNITKKIKIIQQVRSEDKSKLLSQYKKMEVDFVLKSFFIDLQNQIYNSDLIFARCGSSTLAEIEDCKKSSFLFPLPTSLDNHQFMNALEFKKNNNCEIFDESDLDYQRLVKKFVNKIEKLKKNKKKRNIEKKLSLIKIINDMI